jgi:hypothetical protein
MGVRSPDVIPNTDLQTTTNQKPIYLKIKERKWKWIAHTLRSENSIATEALRWNPHGKGRQDARETPGEQYYMKKGKKVAAWMA